MNNKLEAILLAGGNGSRLKPFTNYTSKHLLPIDNVPMIFYPLKNLNLIGVKVVYLVINKEHKDQWDNLIASYDFEMNIIPVIQEVILDQKATVIILVINLEIIQDLDQILRQAQAVHLLVDLVEHVIQAMHHQRFQINQYQQACVCLIA